MSRLLATYEYTQRKKNFNYIKRTTKKETKILSSNLDQVKASMQSYSYEPTSGSIDITTVGGIVCIVYMSFAGVQQIIIRAWMSL